MLRMGYKRAPNMKHINARCIKVILEYSQAMTQALWWNSDPYLQLPHLSDTKMNKLRRKKKGLSLEQFCKLTREQRQEMEIFTQEEFEDVEQVISVLPVNEMKIEVFVEGEEEIVAGDVVTIKVTINLLNFPEK